LAAVTNLLFIVRGDTTLSEAGRQYLSFAEQELMRAAQIAKQTLGFYKDEAEPTKVDISKLLDDVLSFHQRHMSAHIKVEKHFSGKLEIHGLEGEIRQSFSNLVANAVQALSEGGTLQVGAQVAQEQGEPGVLIDVKDDGPGIQPEHMEFLFDPFFTAGKKTGTGLGLWLVRQIVEKHGGSVRVKTNTTPLEHGSCFSIFLPAHERVNKAVANAVQQEMLSAPR